MKRSRTSTGTLSNRHIRLLFLGQLVWVLLLLAPAWLPRACAQAQTRIFLAEYQYNNPKLKGMDLDGANVVELFSPPASDWLLVGCGFVAAKQRFGPLEQGVPMIRGRSVQSGQLAFVFDAGPFGCGSHRWKHGVPPFF